MANRKVTIYVRTKTKGYALPLYLDKAQTRLKPITEGVFYIRYSLGGKTNLETVGTDPYVAIDKKHEKERWLRNYVCAARPEAKTFSQERLTVGAALDKYFRELEIFQGNSGYGTAPRTVKVYRARLNLFRQFCEEEKLEYLDESDNREVLLSYLQYLQCKTTKSGRLFSDRYIFGIFQSLNTLLRANKINTANELLGKLGFEPKKPKKYAPEELDFVFSVMDDEQRLIYSFFLNSACREQEVANTEYTDLLFGKCVLHVCPKPHRNFRLKSKKNRGGDIGDRYVPLPAALMDKLKARMESLGAKANDLVFPSASGEVEGHFLRKLQQIAKQGHATGKFTLHRFRKTAATIWHDQGVPLGTIMTRLGHTSLRVTQLYLELKGGDQSTPEIYEQVNKSAMAAYV